MMKILRTIIQRWRTLAILLAVIGLAVWVIVRANSTPDDHRDQRWLIKQPCAAPCWEGITPGVTTAEDALKLLQQNQLFSDVEVFSPKSRPENSALDWNWYGTNISGEAHFDGSSTTRVIEYIRINLPHPAKLKDVIATFGYPDYVNISAGPGSDMDDRRPLYGMELYYIQSGFSLNMVKSGDDLFRKPTISPETTFTYITFFPTSMDGLSVALRWEKTSLQDALVPWQETFDFDTYCKLQFKSEAIYHCQ